MKFKDEDKEKMLLEIRALRLGAAMVTLGIDIQILDRRSEKESEALGRLLRSGEDIGTTVTSLHEMLFIRFGRLHH